MAAWRIDVPSGTSIDFELIVTLAFLTSLENFSASSAVVGVCVWSAVVVCRLQQPNIVIGDDGSADGITDLPRAVNTLQCPSRDSILGLPIAAPTNSN